MGLKGAHEHVGHGSKEAGTAFSRLVRQAPRRSPCDACESARIGPPRRSASGGRIAALHAARGSTTGCRNALPAPTAGTCSARPGVPADRALHTTDQATAGEGGKAGDTVQRALLYSIPRVRSTPLGDTAIRSSAAEVVGRSRPVLHPPMAVLTTARGGRGAAARLEPVASPGTFRTAPSWNSAHARPASTRSLMSRDDVPGDRCRQCGCDRCDPEPSGDDPPEQLGLQGLHVFLGRQVPEGRLDGSKPFLVRRTHRAHLAPAATFALADRSSAVIFAARARPPARPPAAGSGGRRSSAGGSYVSSPSTTSEPEPARPSARRAGRARPRAGPSARGQSYRAGS